MLSLALTRGQLADAEGPMADREGLLVTQDPRYWEDILNPTQQTLWRRGPLNEMGGPLTDTGATFANTRGSRVSGGLLADTGGNCSLDGYSKGAVCRLCMLKSLCISLCKYYAQIDNDRSDVPNY